MRIQEGGGPVSNIEAQCERVSKTFSTTLEVNPLAAAYMLGNLYHFLNKQHGEQKKLVEQTIKFAKGKLKKDHITALWERIDRLTDEDWKVLPKGNRKSLLALRQNMLHDIDYFRHIDSSSLIDIGQDIDFTREVLIALVRKNLERTRNADPFKKDHFSYDLLKIGGSEENHTYLYEFFNKCSTMPIDAIGKLGEKNLKVAETILKDLSTTSHFFTVSAKLAEYHPKLRSEIAKDWGKITATHPLTPQQQITVPETLNKLQSKYPEFKEVKVDTRVERVQPRGENDILFPAWQHLLGGLVGGGIGFVEAAAVLAAAPTLLPFFLAGGAAFGYAFSESPTVNNMERDVRKKIGSYFK